VIKENKVEKNYKNQEINKDYIKLIIKVTNTMASGTTKSRK